MAEKKTRIVLSVDGGGIKGVIPAMVLSEIEKRTGCSVSEFCDLMAGTSTGGIITLALTKDDGNGNPVYKAEDMVDFYKKSGHRIFQRSMWREILSVNGYLDGKYSVEGVESLLEEHFGYSLLGDSLVKLIVSSYNIQDRMPYLFKSWENKFKNVPVKYVARATTAAPSYFEPALVTVENASKALIDGGIFLENPSVTAYAEAVKLFPGDEIFVISCGTGKLNEPISYDEARKWGKAEWIRPLFDCMFDGMCDNTDYQMSQIVGEKNYIRFQTGLPRISEERDDVSRENIARLVKVGEELIATNNEFINKVVELVKNNKK